MADITRVKPNLATIIRRESSSLPPDALPTAALTFANQLSQNDAEVDYVVLRFDSQTHELGLTYSDALKTTLGLLANHYTLAAGGGTDDFNNPEPPPTPTDAAKEDCKMAYCDPFTAGQSPLALPLPDALNWVFNQLNVLNDFVIVRVSAATWTAFGNGLQTVSERFPVFKAAAQNVKSRFGVDSSAPYIFEINHLRAGDRAGLADWVGRYDQVYSAVLLLRFTSGQTPQEFL